MIPSLFAFLSHLDKLVLIHFGILELNKVGWSPALANAIYTLKSFWLHHIFLLKGHISRSYFTNPFSTYKSKICLNFGGV